MATVIPGQGPPLQSEYQPFAARTFLTTIFNLLATPQSYKLTPSKDACAAASANHRTLRAQAPTVTFNSTAYSPAGIGDWGETTDQFQMVAGQDAYVDLGFHDINGGHSETFSNWNLGEAKAGITAATSFELFAYDLPTALAGGSTITVRLTGAPKGSFVVAFSCKVGGPDAESGLPCPDGKVGSTPFTNAGLVTVTTVPEPRTLMLLGSGLLGLAPLIRRKK